MTKNSAKNVCVLRFRRGAVLLVLLGWLALGTAAAHAEPPGPDRAPVQTTGTTSTAGATTAADAATPPATAGQLLHGVPAMAGSLAEESRSGRLLTLLAAGVGLATGAGLLAGAGSTTTATAGVPESRDTATSPDAKPWASGAAGAYQGGVFGALVPRLRDTARTFVNNNAASLRGFIHEQLWETAHNAQPLRVLRQGIARVDQVVNTKDWDGWLYQLGRSTRVQLKSIGHNLKPSSITSAVRKYAKLADTYGPNERMLVTREFAGDVAERATVAGRVGSSGVAAAEAGSLGELARTSVSQAEGTGARLAAGGQLVGRTAAKAARGGGIIGGVINGGISTYENVTNPDIDNQTKTANIAVDVAGGVVSGAGGAAAGAATGALIGSVVPGAGTLVGAGVGFVVGGAVSWVAQSEWDKHVKPKASGWLARQIKREWN